MTTAAKNKVLEEIVDEAAEFIEEHPDMIQQSKLPSYLRDAIIELGKYHVKYEDELHEGNGLHPVHVGDVRISIDKAISEAHDFIEEHKYMVLEPGRIPSYYRNTILALGRYHMEHEGGLEHHEAKPAVNHNPLTHNYSSYTNKPGAHKHGSYSHDHRNAHRNAHRNIHELPKLHSKPAVNNPVVSNAGDTLLGMALFGLYFLML